MGSGKELPGFVDIPDPGFRIKNITADGYDQETDMDLWRKMTLIRAHELFVLWRDMVVSPEVDRDKLLADTREWLADYESQFEHCVDPGEAEAMKENQAVEEAMGARDE